MIAAFLSWVLFASMLGVGIIYNRRASGMTDNELFEWFKKPQVYIPFDIASLLILFACIRLFV